MHQKFGNTKRGQALMMAVIFFMTVSFIMVIGVISPIFDELANANDLVLSKASYYAGESGLEDVVYRLKQGVPVSTLETITINNTTASTTITDVADTKQIKSVGVKDELYRSVQAVLINGDGVAFHYGVQAGAGGVDLNNTATITGSLFSNGPVTATGNDVKGDVISAGPAGLIDSVHATGSAYAHTIQDSTIDRNAYYQVKTTTTVAGTSYPGSTDQATSSLPITDAQITEWENDAAAGGTVSTCPYSISGTVTLGPKKIACDLDLNNSDTITLTGPLWVTGNIHISNTAKVKIDPSLGNKSVAIIADNPSSRLAGSQITLTNSTEFSGSGQSNSFVLLISQNTSAENGGTADAINIANTVQGELLLYASHGKVSLSNNINLREVTAYKMELNNSANVDYKTGLASLLFSSGPGGGYTFSSWKEVQ